MVVAYYNSFPTGHINSYTRRNRAYDIHNMLYTVRTSDVHCTDQRRSCSCPDYCFIVSSSTYTCSDTYATVAEPAWTLYSVCVCVCVSGLWL